ncbi:MAG: hypothetical protein QW258_00475 [Thermoplasmata archaeon]
MPNISPPIIKIKVMKKNGSKMALGTMNAMVMRIYKTGRVSTRLALYALPLMPLYTLLVTINTNIANTISIVDKFSADPEGVAFMYKNITLDPIVTANIKFCQYCQKA